MAQPHVEKHEDYKWTEEVAPLRERFRKELLSLELLMKLNRATIHQDHISMSMHALEASELLRAVKNEHTGCALEKSIEASEGQKGDGKRKPPCPLWYGLQWLHYTMRKRCCAMFQNFMMT